MRAAGVALGAWLLAGGSAAQADLPRTMRLDILRVLVILDDDEPQFFSGKPGAMPGLDHEILEGFARMHRMALELVPAPRWDALIPQLTQGKGDIIAGR